MHVQQAATIGRSRSAAHRQHGLGLIDVLIALVVLSIGLLGLAGLQTFAMQYNHGAYVHTQANNFAADMADRMRVNRGPAIDGDYNIDFGESPPSGDSVAAQDLNEWINAVAQTLPGGEGAVVIDSSDGTGTIRLRWDGGEIDGDEVDADVPSQLVMRVRL